MPEQTEGEYRVGVNFNPSGDSLVNDIKRKAAELIDIMSGLQGRSDNGEAKRCAALAMTAFEDGAMWAVKAVTKGPR